MILVTGATGILGRVIVLELLKRGKMVCASKRPTSNLEEVKRSLQFYTEDSEDYFNKIKWVEVDFRDADSIDNALIGISEIYHCAAKVSFHPDDNQEMLNCNIEATKQILYACERTKINKFLFVSSIAVLDTKNDNGHLDEDSNFNPKAVHSDYAISKHFAEMEVWRASAEGLNTIIVNPGVIIGSGNWKKSSGTLFDQLINNKFSFAGGSAYVDARDVSKFAVDLMEKEVFGERFILISGSKSYEDTANYLRQKVDKRNVIVLPKSILKIGLFFNFFLGWLIKPLRMLNSANVNSVSNQSKISNQKIKLELNEEFIGIEQSLDFHLKNYLSDTDLVKNIK